MDLTLHPTRFPVSLEKWYIDTLLDDGSALLVYLGAITLCAVRLARVTAELYPAHGPVVRGSATVRHVLGGENILRFGPATICGRSPALYDRWPLRRIGHAFALPTMRATRTIPR